MLQEERCGVLFGSFGCHFQLQNYLELACILIVVIRSRDSGEIISSKYKSSGLQCRGFH